MRIVRPADDRGADQRDDHGHGDDERSRRLAPVAVEVGAVGACLLAVGRLELDDFEVIVGSVAGGRSASGHGRMLGPGLNMATGAR